MVTSASTLLRNRKSGQRLSWKEKEFIWKLHLDDNTPLATLQHRFQVSLSTLKRIIAQSNSKVQGWKGRGDVLGMKMFLSRKIKKAASSYIFSKDEIFRSHNVWQEINTLFKVDIDAKTMSKFMKTQMGLSFKRITSRPLSLDVERQYILKILFAIVLTKRLQNINLLINVDESTLSTSTKTNYTWTLKGVPASAKNTKSIKSMNLITWIWSSGSSYSAVAKGTMNSKGFLCFLKHLIEDIKGMENVDPNEILLILDNVPVHQANIILEFINESRLKWVFLPQYSPELAPVETMFAIL